MSPVFFRFLNFRALFACSIFWTYPVTKTKQMLCRFAPFAIFALKNVVIVGFGLSVYCGAKFKIEKKPGDSTNS